MQSTALTDRAPAHQQVAAPAHVTHQPEPSATCAAPRHKRAGSFTPSLRDTPPHTLARRRVPCATLRGYSPTPAQHSPPMHVSTDAHTLRTRAAGIDRLLLKRLRTAKPLVPKQVIDAQIRCAAFPRPATTAMVLFVQHRHTTKPAKKWPGCTYTSSTSAQ